MEKEIKLSGSIIKLIDTIKQNVKPFTTIDIDALEIKEISEKVFERYYLSGKYLLISKKWCCHSQYCRQ